MYLSAGVPKINLGTRNAEPGLADAEFVGADASPSTSPPLGWTKRHRHHRANFVSVVSVLVTAPEGTPTPDEADTPSAV